MNDIFDILKVTRQIDCHSKTPFSIQVGETILVNGQIFEYTDMEDWSAVTSCYVCDARQQCSVLMSANVECGAFKFFRLLNH